MKSWQVGDIIYCIDKSDGFIEPYQVICKYDFHFNIAAFSIESLLDGNCKQIILDEDKSRIIDFPEKMYGFDIDKLYDEYAKEIESKQIHKAIF